MLYIKKGHEPKSLTKYRKRKHAYFDGYKEKEDIRKSLLMEQGYLCAYCMRRIDILHMKIEHWYPEDQLSDAERLDYHNMLGVCLGHIEGTKGADDTCDTHKGNTVITINPQDKATIKKINYRTATGEIYSDNKQIQKDLDQTLNLNSEKHLLKANRAAIFQAFIIEMQRMQKKGIWSYNLLKEIKIQYEKSSAEGKKKEYAGIMIWYLEKRLGQ